ncbi:MAG: insulinase family protein [Planctomycetes bacterium]|nr:insulinase family protein [Planctomycetota bacterium]
MKIVKVRDKSIREEYYQTRLACGLPVIIIPKKKLHKKTAVVAVNYGSIDNEFKVSSEKEFTAVPAGIAHFLEHQLFKKADGDISREFAKHGAYYNASTGYNTTNYFFTATDNFTDNLKTLTRLAREPYFSEQYVATEKNIIEQELRMYHDIPDFKVIQNLMTNLYHRHPVRIEIGGTIESVRIITPEVLMKCYRTFYNPANMVLVISGDLEHHEVFKMLEGEWIDKETKKSVKSVATAIERRMPAEPARIKNKSAQEKMSVTRPHILLGYKETNNGLDGEALIRQNMVTDIMLELLFDRSGKLYNRLYEDKLIDDKFGAWYYGQTTYGFTTINAETDDPDKLKDCLLAGIRQAKQARFKKRDLDRLKKKFIGKYIWGFNSPEAIAFMFSTFYFYGINILELPRMVKKVSLADINQRLEQHLDERYLAESVVNPLGTTDARR